LLIWTVSVAFVAIGGFVGVVLLALYSPCTQSARQVVRNALCSCDFVFCRTHYELPHHPYTETSTLLGGVLTLVFALFAIAVAVFLAFSAIALDRYAVDSYSVPGLLSFRPVQTGRTVFLTIFVVGTDRFSTRCDEICDAQHEEGPMLQTSDNLRWHVECSAAPDRGGCRIDAEPVVEAGRLLPPSFWLSVRLPQSRVHAWQWRVESRFREDETVYFSSTNVTARADTVLAGSEPSRGAIDLQPTTYTGNSGYAPFATQALRGSVADAASFFQFPDGSFECACNLTFAVPKVLHEFELKDQLDLASLYSKIVAVLSIANVCFVVAFLVTEVTGKKRLHRKSHMQKRERARSHSQGDPVPDAMPGIGIETVVVPPMVHQLLSEPEVWAPRVPGGHNGQRVKRSHAETVEIEVPRLEDVVDWNDSGSEDLPSPPPRTHLAWSELEHPRVNGNGGVGHAQVDDDDSNSIDSELGLTLC